MVSSQQQQKQHAAAALESGLVPIKVTSTVAKCSTVQQKPPAPIRVTARSMLHESTMRPAEFQRYYKMTFESFRELCNKLRAGVEAATESMALWKTKNNVIGGDTEEELAEDSDAEDYYQNYSAPRGPHRKIPTSICVACAIRYIAGGSDPFDLFTIHEITVAEVCEAVWYVVCAVNHMDDFGIKYPAEHEKLHQMASDLGTATKLRLDESTRKALKAYLCPRKKPTPGLKRAPRTKR